MNVMTAQIIIIIIILPMTSELVEPQTYIDYRSQDIKMYIMQMN